MWHPLCFETFTFIISRPDPMLPCTFKDLKNLHEQLKNKNCTFYDLKHVPCTIQELKHVPCSIQKLKHKPYTIQELKHVHFTT